MTSNQSTQRDLSNTVVVGVNGTDDNLGALRFAVAEAQTLSAALKLVHVVPDHLPVPAMMPTHRGGVRRDRPPHPDHPRTPSARIAPDLPVEAWLHHGTRPVELVASADGARELVVGRDGHSLVERLLRGDIATGVAARAEVPVIEVPADWHPTSSDAERVVVAGVKVPSHAAELLADAFEVAQQRNATLVVLHAWRLPSAYSDIVDSPAAAAEWVRQSTLEIEDSAAELARPIPRPEGRGPRRTRPSERRARRGLPGSRSGGAGPP